jgi:hypothetical protein
MIGMRVTIGGFLGVLVTAMLAVGTGIAPADAESLSPWWGLTSGARPTSIQPGLAKDEVQEIVVSATAGSFALLEPRRSALRLFKWDASRQEVQSGLEEIYGTGNVEVSSGRGNEKGTEPYVIAFTGELADQPVEPMKGISLLSCEGAIGEGCTQEVTLLEKVKGRHDGEVVVMAENLGDKYADGATSPISITDNLPKGLKAVGIEGVTSKELISSSQVECSLKSVSCTYMKSLSPYETIEVRVFVAVKPGAVSGEENEASISGGDAATSRTVKRHIEIGGGEAQFGVEDYGLVAEEVGGASDQRAGSHPFQLTTTLDLNENGEALPAGAQTKDLWFELPPGLIGNPTPLPRCTDAQFSNPPASTFNDCPPQTAVGVANVRFNEPRALGLNMFAQPIFNMVPRAGEPARFGFLVGIVPVFLDTSVRTGGDYGVTVSVNNITEIVGFLGNRVTFWGTPGDPRHDRQRGWGCFGAGSNLPCKSSEEVNPPPFLSLPTSCTGPLQTTVQLDSWKQPGLLVGPIEPNELMMGLDGCNHLPFEPSVSVKPDVPNASSPTGLTVGVHVPQSSAMNPTGLAESTVKDTTVTLPVGIVLNPAGADGLAGCSSEQIGFLSGVSSGEDLRFTPGFPSCPDGSKVGTVKIKTPLLPNALEGAIYLASQSANPFGSLVALYLVAEDPVSGTLIKLAGEVILDSTTGQLVSTFMDTPSLPFEDLEIHFFGGSRAPLSTPALCGSYRTIALFGPWSAEPSVGASSTFDITSGPNGGPCQNPLPFSPSLTAGTTSIQAGGFSPFTMTMSRPDGSQNLQAIKLRMPPGLLGTLATVKLCKEEQANAGTCGPESLIGHTTVSVGVGGDPYSVRGGEVFITEGYKGAPYGLSIVNPAKAGPYDLGKVIVRAKIEVDQISAVLTVTTDDTGPYKIPTILDGIPLQIQHVNVTIDRPGFTFNPTNCSPLAITGSLTSDQGATKNLSVPFQITNCAVLAFKPKLTAKTAGKTSRAKGASLSVKLTYPAGPYDANIAKVKVDLPKQLPSRLTTLQKACPAATFEANPANCPSASIVGHATATTPVMPVPLTGPAYFVSHGGEQFPDLIIVLQGYGATVHLVGSTFISKAGITSSTFKSIPDVPVGTFELTLPQGKDSALAANKNLCTTTKLTMPTQLIAQNGAVIKATTPIVPTGCAKKAHKTSKNHKEQTHKKQK